MSVLNVHKSHFLPSWELEKGPTFPERVGICVIVEQTWSSDSENDH